jgi:hypothetical protein
MKRIVLLFALVLLWRPLTLYGQLPSYAHLSSIGGKGTETEPLLGVTAAGSEIVAGVLSDTALIGQTMLSATPPYQTIFLAKKTGGNYDWVQAVASYNGTMDFITLSDLKLKNGTIYLVGKINHNGAADALVALYTATGNSLYFRDTGMYIPSCVDADADGNYYLGGSENIPFLQ